MNEAFAIQGYSTTNQLLCVVDGADIYQADYLGNRKLIGKTLAAYSELETTTTEYYNKLVELGVIIPPKEPEEMMAQMQSTMAEMAGLIKALSAEVKELKQNGSERHCQCGEPDVSQRRPAGRDRKSGAGPQRDAGLPGGSGGDGPEAGPEPADGG